MQQFDTSPRHCLSCERFTVQNRMCAVCQASKPSREFEVANIRAHEDRSEKTALICKGCVQEGFAARYARAYTCSACHRKRGRRSFDTTQINNFLVRSGPLRCTECESEHEKRVVDLRGKVQRSKRKCRGCRNVPVVGHREKCQLFSTRGQQLWPGTDTGVTQGDRDFLKRQKPTWWQKASGL